MPTTASRVTLPVIRKDDSGEQVSVEEKTPQKEGGDAEVIGKRKRTQDAEGDDIVDDDAGSEDEGAGGENEDMAENEKSIEEEGQLDQSLITLSALPRSKWVTLADLDVIRVCTNT